MRKKHLEQGRCSGGSNPHRGSKVTAEVKKTYPDRRKELINLRSKTYVQYVGGLNKNERKGEFLSVSGTYSLCGGIHGKHTVHPPSRGFACKVKTRQKRVYTQRQLDFVEYCFMRGVKGVHGGNPAYKYSADRAANEMRLHGTVEGQALHPAEPYWQVVQPDSKPTFGVRELLDHWAIKQWFNNSKDSFCKAVANARKRVVDRIEEIADPDDGDEDMDEDDEQ
jgi:hypothetical protein